jgi:hypothetical protein
MTNDQGSPEKKDVCPSCENPAPFNVRTCPYCQYDIGFPNVRAASSPAEKAALSKLYEEATLNNTSSMLKDFEQQVAQNSEVVICKGLADVFKLLEPNSMLASFHNEISSGARIVEDNKWDKVRGSVDELLFPEYSSKINFGALSLDKIGDSYYGGYSLTIDTAAVAKRSTLFHQNSIKFMCSNSINAGTEIPLGYRCCWEDRGQLSAIKLSQEIGDDTDQSSFPSYLLKQASDEDSDGEYIEVHIYGYISGAAVRHIFKNDDYEPGEESMLNSRVTKAKIRGIPLTIGGKK